VRRATNRGSIAIEPRHLPTSVGIRSRKLPAARPTYDRPALAAHGRCVGYNVGMQRQLLLLALLVGCGSVAQDPMVDGGHSQPADVLDGTLRTGCILALHMDEPVWSGVTGEVKDDCGGDNPGTAVGAGLTTVAGGVRGRAGSFSGGGCVEIPNAASLHATTGLTMSAWIFPTQLDGGINNANGVISKRTDTDDQSEYNLSVWTGDHVYVDLDGKNDRFNGNATIALKRWTQLTVVYDGTQLTDQRVHLYVNGLLDVAKRETSASLTAFSSTLSIGCMPAPAAGTQQNFIGQIDEVAIWNRALSSDELMRWYTNTKL
jgi:hypothetical protein